MSAKIVTSRRKQLAEFRDLFTALFKIPDHDVQTRVLNAINGIIDGNCQCKCIKDTKEIATQTEETPTAMKINTDDLFRKSDTPDSCNINKNNSCNNYFGEFLNNREVKRRKRTKRVPRVEKVSEANKSSLTGSINMKRIRRMSSNDTPCIVKIPKRVAEETIPDLLDGFDDYDILAPFVAQDVTEKKVIETMKHEWETSLVRKNGLLPIHIAILENESRCLRRQIYVLKYMKLNIHKLLTDENETPLQLAVKANCLLSIIKELLSHDADIDEVDKDGNTIIHLAILNVDSTKVLSSLLEKTDLRLLLLTNDNGSTPLHTAVAANKFLMCKTILEHIDKKLGLTSPGVGIEDEKKLLEVYKNTMNEFTKKEPILLNSLKQKIINKIDMKHGRTALLFALRNQSELMAFMLMSHLADPKVADHTGMDCQAFITEYYENARLSAALVNTLLYRQICSDATNRNLVQNIKIEKQV